MSLTTEQLDKLARIHGLISRSTDPDAYDEFSALIDAARLGVAWAECEAALPEGTCDLAVYHFDEPDREDGEYAPHSTPAQYGAKTCVFPQAEWIYARGFTPTAALLALRDALGKR
jgi:hypothetical protein